MVIFVYREVFMGGAETLIARMSKWLTVQREKVIILTEGINSKSKKSIDLLFDPIGVKFEIVSKITSFELEKVIMKHANSQDEIKLFLFEFVFLMIMENMKKKSYNIKKIFYSVVPMKKPVNFFKIFYYKYIESNIYIRFYDNCNIIFMDQMCGNEAEEYYSINLSSKEERTFPLPMYLNAYDKDLVKQRYRDDIFNILTIARADFPFKGYILGLIDNFANLKNKHTNITLTIISYGKDKERIKEKISGLPEQIKSDISLVGPVNYEDLKYHFKNANVFVGMGTTLLDAANYGVPGITIHAFTYKAIATGFFYRYPHILGNSEFEKNIELLIEQIIQMSEQEYELLAENSYTALKEMYDVEIVMPRLMSLIESQKNLDVGLYLSIVVFLRKIKSMLSKFRS